MSMVAVASEHSPSQPTVRRLSFFRGTEDLPRYEQHGFVSRHVSEKALETGRPHAIFCEVEAPYGKFLTQTCNPITFACTNKYRCTTEILQQPLRYGLLGLCAPNKKDASLNGKAVLSLLYSAECTYPDTSDDISSTFLNLLEGPKPILFGSMMLLVTVFAPPREAIFSMWSVLTS